MYLSALYQTDGNYVLHTDGPSVSDWISKPIYCHKWKLILLLGYTEQDGKGTAGACTNTNRAKSKPTLTESEDVAEFGLKTFRQGDGIWTNIDLLFQYKVIQSGEKSNLQGRSLRAGQWSMTPSKITGLRGSR